MAKDEWVRREQLLALFEGKKPVVSGTCVTGLDDGSDFPNDVSVQVTVEGGDVVVWVSLLDPECNDFIVFSNGCWSEN